MKISSSFIPRGPLRIDTPDNLLRPPLGTDLVVVDGQEIGQASATVRHLIAVLRKPDEFVQQRLRIATSLRTVETDQVADRLGEDCRNRIRETTQCPRWEVVEDEQAPS